MDRKEILKKVNEVLCEIFDDTSIVINEETTAADVEGWDSLRHITIIEEIEDTFDVRFTMKEVNGMKNIGEMTEIIASKM